VERTTIAIPPQTRDRLRRYGAKGMSYAQILNRMMDELDRDRFVAEMRRLADEGEFIPLERA
jgi:acetate kinase